MAGEGDGSRRGQDRSEDGSEMDDGSLWVVEQVKRGAGDVGAIETSDDGRRGWAGVSTITQGAV